MRRATTYRDLQTLPMVAALTLALLAGFPLGIGLALARANVIAVGPWWPALVQAHGHVQLFGWMALFVIGVGSYFFPRMRGAPLAYPQLLTAASWLLSTGIVLRVVAQSALAIGSRALAARAALALSGAAEVAGIGCFVVLLAATVRFGPPVSSRRGLSQVLSFLGPGFASLALAAVVSALAAARAARDGAAVLDGRADAVVVALLLDAFVVPVAFAVAVQALPLFLRLAVPPPNVVRAMGAAYTVAAVVHALAIPWTRVAAVADLAVAALGLAMIFLLDVVTRSRTPWTAGRVAQRVAEGTRPGMPDRGEYGRFELLVRGAFVWLGLAFLGRLVDGIAALTGVAPSLVAADAIRHAITVGFVTILIAGMAVRMVPGFAKTKLPRPALVTPLAIVLHLAAFCRVAPALVPGRVDALLAASGPLAWCGIVVLAGLLAPMFAKVVRARS